MKHHIRFGLMGFMAAACVIGGTTRAEACGGFFCSQVQPVNQAAERIIFANNGDGTQTAVIEIMYQGPSEHFSWVLPISSVPMGSQIKVASDIAFQRLQAATNPQYSLTTTVEGTCKPMPVPILAGSGGTSAAGGPMGSGGTGGATDNGGVHVEASGVVGSFDWTVISLDASVSDASAAAVKWLGDNGYDVPAGAPALLGPYLADGLYLLALKLTKGSDTGSIRPIVLTYKGDHAMIPIKLTAVSANDNMGVMTWLLGDSRAVPMNYLSLELNEARINWFNASSNYNDVVTAAADDAGGQGFVTELAGPTSALASAVWSASDDATWTQVKSRTYASFSDILQTTQALYGGYDGYWDAVQAVITLPSGVTFADFKQCTNCYASQIQVPPSQLMQKLEELVITPIRDVQTLLTSHAHVTRLYTTMSAEEMTLDPLFTFNPDLADVSNVHTATRVIECSPDVYQSEAPWRIELPQGGVIRGTGSTVGTWPADLASEPPNRVITRQGDSGTGKTIEDNTDVINAALDAYNASLPPVASGSGGTSAGGASNGGSAATGGATAGRGGTAGEMPGDHVIATSSHHDGGCSTAPTGSRGAVLVGLLGLLLFGIRRRRAA